MTIIEPIRATHCECCDTAQPLTSVKDAMARGLALIDPVSDVEQCGLNDALGRVLAQAVTARGDQPRFDNSGMDGYALCLSDLPPNGVMPILGVSAAGNPVQTLTSGTMMRIYTGAPVPRGADAIVMQENVAVHGAKGQISGSSKRGDHIRRAGEDTAQGCEILPKGTRITPRHVALCAGAGVGMVQVYRRLCVGLIATGDELTQPGDALSDGAIWDVNTPMITALCRDAGVDVVEIRHVQDDLASLTAAMKTMSRQVDVVITSGGVSVGDRDHVKPALSTLNADIAVSGVAIKPGKPITIAQLNGALFLGLPGNPVSAFVTWQIFGRALLDHMAGGTILGNPRRYVRADADLHHKPGRCEYRPATLVGHGEAGLDVIQCADQMRSGNLSPLIDADGLVLIPADTDHVAAGDLLEFLPV